jgi:hypothetical protein
VAGLVPQHTRLTGKCDVVGIIGEGWRIGPSQFLHVDRVAGFRTGRPPHTLAFWFIIRNITEGDVPLATLGAVWQPAFGRDVSQSQPTGTGGDIDHAAQSFPVPPGPDVLSQEGTFAGASGAKRDGGTNSSAGAGGVHHVPHAISKRMITLRASQRLCQATPALSSPLAARSPQPALALGVPSRDNAEFYHCSGVRVQTNVWYHVAWSYHSGVSGGTGAAPQGADNGGLMTLFVNGRLRRRIPVSEDLDLGSNYRHGDGGGRVSLFMGRDPVERKTNATWTVFNMKIIM